MKTLYIAGPYRAATGAQIRENIRRASDAFAEVLRAGFAAVCPHTMTAEFDYLHPDIADDVYLQMDLELLRRCDAVLLLPGSEKSSGARAEVAFANENCIPVFATLQAAQDWFAGK